MLYVYKYIYIYIYIYTHMLDSVERSLALDRWLTGGL